MDVQIHLASNSLNVLSHESSILGNFNSTAFTQPCNLNTFTPMKYLEYWNICRVEQEVASSSVFPEDHEKRKSVVSYLVFFLFSDIVILADETTLNI